MRTIALLTDFGSSDNFVGVMKGVILDINPRLNLVDISHNVKPQDISSAAFLLKGSYRYFPRQTIFLAVVDPGVGSKRNPLIIRSKNYFFVGPDNGVLSLAAKEDGIKEVIAIENKRYFLKPLSDTFHGRDIFAPVCAYLSKGRRCACFGRALDSIRELNIPEPRIDKNRLKGEVIYIDRFGNLITNIDKNLFIPFTQNKNFKIRIKDRELDSVATSYQAVKAGRLLAVFGSFGFLEISINGGSARNSLGAKKGTIVSITL